MTKMLSKLTCLSALVFFACFAQGCLITEECSREGLTVVTNGWPNQNWSSTCIGGFWVDTPIGHPSEELIKIYPDCKVILCYDGIGGNCECSNDVYPESERDKS